MSSLFKSVPRFGLPKNCRRSSIMLVLCRSHARRRWRPRYVASSTVCRARCGLFLACFFAGSECWRRRGRRIPKFGSATLRLVSTLRRFSSSWMGRASRFGRTLPWLSCCFRARMTTSRRRASTCRRRPGRRGRRIFGSCTNCARPTSATDFLTSRRLARWIRLCPFLSS